MSYTLYFECGCVEPFLTGRADEPACGTFFLRFCIHDTVTERAMIVQPSFPQSTEEAVNAAVSAYFLQWASIPPYGMFPGEGLQYMEEFLAAVEPGFWVHAPLNAIPIHPPAGLPDVGLLLAPLNAIPIHPPAGLPDIGLLLDVDGEEEYLWDEGADMWVEWGADEDEEEDAPFEPFEPWVGENDLIPSPSNHPNSILPGDTPSLDWY